MILRNLDALFSNPLQFFLNLLYSLPAILIALTVHEMAHGLVAYWCGDDTAKRMGRLTLNPMAHLDPMGTVLLLLVGFGYAKPVPVNPNRFKHPRRDDIFVSLAGITANLLVFLLTFGLWYGMRIKGVQNQFVLDFINVLMMYNVSIAMFNLLPIPPLDGFHVVNDIFFKGNLYLDPRIGQYSMFAILLLSFTGILGRLISFGANGMIDFGFWIFTPLFRAFGWL